MYRLALRISVVELRPKEFPRSWRLLNMETIVGSRDREENGTGNSHHLLFIPMIMQAHFAPAIRLAEKLSARGLKIIIVTISKHAESLNKIYTPEGLLKLGLSVEVVEDPKIDPKLPGAWSPLNVAKCMEESCRPLQQRLLGKKKAGSPYPTCMLADKFFTWSKEYAEQLDIPRYAYISYAAVTTRLMQVYHEFEDDLKQIPDGPGWQRGWYEIFHGKPGLEFLSSASDLPGVSRSSGWFDFVIEVGRTICTADGVVMNSFSELESKAVEAIRNGSSGSRRQKATRVFPIGPISDLRSFRNESYVSNTDDSHAECMEWLEKQPTKSVLYVCLGSQVVLEKEQIGHFARALDASQQTFLWVLSKRRGNFSILDDVLPEGFLTRTCGRGLVVTGWVGQLQVLAHPSVVGFVSHCGWQSVLESMTFGVPIIGWPHGAEQHFNCRYVQQVLKAGIGIRDVDNRALIVDQLEFENAFKLFSREKLGKALAFNAASFARKAAAAVSRGGSSNEAIDELIESIKQPREIHEN
ncbi:protein MpUGT12 [Marchantia polymorpha subsp. ruderalis]|uniref:Glycosyltransferase n=1 Tax=Marchantia polymorpha TaxID=3197 RepID=A0A2R6W0C3_MARPO|nr:hypothetical protein MARPO_0207s0003 [Marchantia polymorpha]BBN03579.1 hypothetical protein Mp_2g24650 [Marchantia polymorpha subsp. ruderalis]|eukprot:PTQ27293.1 hypothetical protein MARPO_0207s0003 [Marchantia polymorpha]